MPFIGTVEFRNAWATQPASAPSGNDIKVAGNGAANLTTTGMTVLSGVSGQDDTFAYITLPFDFFFFGTNYGNNASNFYWNTNNVIGFGAGNGTITWASNTGRGVLIGNTDRRTNTFYYSPMLTASNYNYINYVLFAQNIYNDNVPNAIQWQIRMFRSVTIQYIEVRASTAPATGGVWNITNSTIFQNTYGGFTNVGAGTSFVLQSDGNGSNWQFFNNYNIPV
jgi:hypothetical protein